AIAKAVSSAVALIRCPRPRSDAAQRERGKEDHALSEAALSEIKHFSNRLRDLANGYGKPPRPPQDYSNLHLAPNGRIKGGTIGTGPYDSSRERILITHCLVAAERRGQRRYNAVRRLLLELSGKALVDLAETEVGKSKDELRLLMLAHEGERRY